MNLRIEYEESGAKGSIHASPDLPAHVWNRVREVIVGAEPDAIISKQAARCDWFTVLAIAPRLSALRSRHGFSLEYSEAAKAQLVLFRRDYLAVRRAADALHRAIPADQVAERLRRLGFTRRALTPEQSRDTARLIAMPHGANFSVPGAGKTTVALAVHLLTRDEDTHLLVVAPRNAFMSWDEAVDDCFDPSDPRADTARFTRLTGGIWAIRQILRSPPLRAIISYDQLIRAAEPIRWFMTSRKVHLIVDESHRMKAGGRSQRGAVLLSLAHLPVRRDILSGTPIPHALDDIVPQLGFLWPGQRLGPRVLAADRPNAVISDLHVRTTKDELGLPAPHRHFEQVGMSDPQLALYSLMRQEVLSRLTGIRRQSNIDLASARRSVMRLLQASSNPILVVRALTQGDPLGYPYDDTKLEGVFMGVIEETDSPKIRRACELARQLALSGERCVIWSSFVYNVERVAVLLADLGATYIHGGVDTGSERDEDTREGRIRLFHDDTTGCRVLVANPAACSEGISLHKVCHHAIYVDRTYNAAHYLQSVDRIHRLGLLPGTETHIHVLESIAPSVTGAIDFSVRRRLIAKLRVMAGALEDPDLRLLALDEEAEDAPIDYGIGLDDLADLVEELEGGALPPGGEA